MAVKLKRNVLVGIKSETTQGTAVSCAATDFLQIDPDVSIKPIAEAIDRTVVMDYLGPIGKVTGKRSAEVSFKTELKGNGTPCTAATGFYAPLSAALAACGLSAIYTAGTYIKYGPSSTAESTSFDGPGRSCTIEVYRGGIKQVVAGALGSFKISGIEVGKIPMLEFSFKGLYSEYTDAAHPATTVNNTAPPVCLGTTLTVQGITPVATKVDYDHGANSVERADIASTSGIRGYIITDYAPKSSYDPEVDTVASHNAYNKLMNSTTGAVNIKIGSTSGNMFTIQLPCVQYESVDYADRNGILTYNIPLKVCNTGTVSNSDFFSMTAY